MGKVYQELIESFGYIAEGPSAEELIAKIKQQPAMSYAANKLGSDQSGQGAQARQGDASSSFVSDKPAGDPSRMVPGEIRYAPGYDPNAQPSSTDTPTDQKTDTTDKTKPKPKPKARYPFYPGVKAYQFFANVLGLPIKVDGRAGPETIGALDKVSAKVQEYYPKMKYGKPGYNQEYELWQKKSEEQNDLLSAVNAQGNASIYGPILQKWGYDPKTGDPIKKSLKIGQGAQADNKSTSNATAPATGGRVKDVLGKVPNPKHGDEYWVDGSRYEFKDYGFNPTTGQRLPGAGWFKNFEPGDWGLNSNQAAAKAGYTGPDSEKSKSDQAPASTESTELDAIRRLAGM